MQDQTVWLGLVWARHVWLCEIHDIALKSIALGLKVQIH